MEVLTFNIGAKNIWLRWMQPWHSIMKKEQLYLETDMSGCRSETSLLQVRDKTQFPREWGIQNAVLQPIAFESKWLTDAETYYSIIEREALGILHGFEKFHNYCFAHWISMIMDHKPLAISKKYVASWSYRPQRIPFQIWPVQHQNIL